MSLAAANPALFALRSIFRALQKRGNDPYLETARITIVNALKHNDLPLARAWLQALTTACMAAFADEPEMLARIRQHLGDLAEIINDGGKE